MFIVIMILLILGLPAVMVLVRTIYRKAQRSRHGIAAPGIEEAGLVTINGIRQYLHIRGRELDNPVLLLLHGGPGSPMTAMLHSFQYAWEDSFTVVEWDQRQSGKTYFANDELAVADTLNFETVLEDAWQVTQYLQQRFGVKKIVLMGHSWGTVLGTALVQTYPDAFSCYIGVGQVTNLQNNEKMGYEEVLKRARAAGNAKDVSALAALDGYPGTAFSDVFCRQMSTLRKYQQKYGLAEVISFRNVMLVFASPYYSIKEGLYFVKNTISLHRALFGYMFEEYDARRFGLTYQVPVYYIMGENDYQTPVPLARELFEELAAPEKKIFLIPNAGHFTMKDNPQAFNKALLGDIHERICGS